MYLRCVVVPRVDGDMAGERFSLESLGRNFGRVQLEPNNVKMTKNDIDIGVFPQDSFHRLVAASPRHPQLTVHHSRHVQNSNVRRCVLKRSQPVFRFGSVKVIVVPGDHDHGHRPFCLKKTQQCV